METKVATQITIQATIQAPIDKVWKCWTTPEDIVKWNNASDDWHSPKSENDLRVGGRFNTRMEAKDGSMGFDFSGVYDKVSVNELIEYTLDDNRKVNVKFTPLENKTEVSETFEAESENSIELQHDGWQSILNNFKKYVEQNI
jgi:uncharacterized protein YndB with AHSA1/START domain